MSLYASYRGRAAFDAETVERPEKGPMVKARIAVNIAGPTSIPSDRDDLTEWVNVIAFGEKQRRLLEATRKGDTVSVMGPVTASFYRTKNGERRYSRTIIAEAVMTLARTAHGTAAGPTDVGAEAKRALAEAADEMIQPAPPDETPTLDD